MDGRSSLAQFLWHSFLPFFNELRGKCRLRTMRYGSCGGTIIADNAIPFCQMWSPVISARPADWPEHISLTGFFVWDQQASEVDEASAAMAPLVKWLQAGPPPICVNFGSMVFDGAKAAHHAAGRHRREPRHHVDRREHRAQ